MFQLVAERLQQPVEWRRGAAEDAEAAAHVAAILAQPLTADGAVQVALLENRALQAEYEDLGIAQADLVQAGLLRNPVLGWSRQAGSGMVKTVWGVELDFLGLLLAAPRQRIEGIRFELTQLRVAQAVLRHAAETRKAWAEALAAEQSAGFFKQVRMLAEAEAELGERQRKAGNLSLRDALRKQAFAVEIRLEAARASEKAHAARERLNRLMGLWGAQTAWKLPSQLPEIPAQLPQYPDLEAYGLAQRLDVHLAQKEVEALAAALGLTRGTRFIHVLDLGVETEKSTGEKRLTGPTLKLELPLFDQGQARLSRQEALYRQSVLRLHDLEVSARSEIREAWQRLATAHGAAKQARDVLLPLYKQIVEQSTLYYNGMLIGVYELLADARAQVGAVHTYIEALRDYWTALADLQLAVGGRLPQEAATKAGAAMEQERKGDTE
ncbi:MAG: TolC family protein [Methylophilaceae bacterium]|nr:TolC family protein [Methylophilaceae bacterium]